MPVPSHPEHLFCSHHNHNHPKVLPLILTVPAYINRPGISPFHHYSFIIKQAMTSWTQKMAHLSQTYAKAALRVILTVMFLSMHY